MWLDRERAALAIAMASTALLALSGAAGAQVRDNSVRSGDIRDGNVRAQDLARNSVGSSEIKTGAVGAAEIRRNAVRAAEIATNAVRSAELAANSVGTSEVDDDSLTGNDILESSLGQIPRAGQADFATRAGDASTVGGIPASSIVTTNQVVPFRVALSFGQKVEFISAGPVGLEADCRANISGNQDELRLLARSTTTGAFMQGDTPHGGPGVGSDFLTPGTPEDNRTIGGIVSTAGGADQPAAEDDVDGGFVAGPNGEYIGIDGHTMYALDVGGSDCLLVGVAIVSR